MPGPSSSTIRVAVGQPDRTTPSGGLHFAALSNRLVTARSSPAASPATDHRSTSDPKDRVGARRRTRASGAGDDVVEVDGRDDRRHRVVAGELDQVADQRGQLLDLGTDVAEQLDPCLLRQVAAGLREQVEVGAQGGQRRAQLVAGVGHQLALPVAGCRQRGQHRVEGPREPGDLVVALDGQRLAGPRSARSPRPSAVSRRTGRSPLRATAQPAAAAAMTPASAEEQHDDAELGERPLLRVERLGEHQRLPRVLGGHGRRPGSARRRRRRWCGRSAAERRRGDARTRARRA